MIKSAQNEKHIKQYMDQFLKFKIRSEIEGFLVGHNECKFWSPKKGLQIRESDINTPSTLATTTSISNKTAFLHLDSETEGDSSA